MPSTDDKKKTAAAPPEPDFWEKFFAWTQLIYMMRVPIISGGVIFLLPLIAGFLAPTLLKGLFDLTEHPFQSSLWFSLFTFLFAWTVMVTAKLVLFYGPERGCLGDGARNWFGKNVREKYLIKYSIPFGIVFIGTCFTLSGIFWFSKLAGWDYLYVFLGLALGAILALLALFITDYLQNSFYDSDDAKDIRYMLFPFNSDILKNAREDSSWEQKPRKKGLFARLSKRIKSHRVIGRGYFDYDEPGDPLQAGHSTAFVLFIVFFLIYLCFGFFPNIYASISSTLGFKYYDIPWGVPAIVYLPVLGAVLCWSFGAMSFFLDSYRIPVIAPIAVLIFLISFVSDQGHIYASFDTAVKSEVIKPQDVAPDEDYIIVVAADGGGIQAAGWTAKVLSGLEEACRDEPAFGDQASKLCGAKIRLISSVSGGSVGAMYFVDAYTAENRGLPPDKKDLGHIVTRAEASSLSYVAWGLAYPDFFNSIWNVFPTDRGREIEKAWAENNYTKKSNLPPDQIEAAKKSLTKPLSTWKDGVREGWRPAVIFNSTVAETGERILISTSDINERNPGYNEQSQVPQDCQSMVEANFKKRETGSRNFYEIFPCSDLPVVTAARLSATFPYVTPAARSQIKGEYHNYNRMHIVDGGYYDNYGISSLIEWLNQLLSKKDTRLTKVIVLQIRSNDTGYDAANEPADGWAYQLLAPLKTLYNVRTSGQRSRGDLEFSNLKDLWETKGVSIQSVIFNFALQKQLDKEQNRQSKAESEPPLSWHLTTEEKERIEEAWNTNLTTPDKGWDKFKKILICFRDPQCTEFSPKTQGAAKQ